MRLQNIVRLGALLLIVGTVAGELTLRRMGYGRRVMTALDEELGWVRVPDQRVVTREGIEVAINSMGFRDREWDPPADASTDDRTLRVATLGNSVPAGNRLAIEDSWGRRLEERLHEYVRNDARWDDAIVMNFCGPGYGIEQMARIYKMHVRPYRPDFVIASVSIGSLRPLRPSRSERDYPLKRELQSTAIYDWLQREVAEVHGVGGYADEAGLTPEQREQVQLVELARRILGEAPFTEEAEPLWELGRDWMGELAADLAARDGELLLLYMPRLGEVDPQLPGRAVKRWQDWAVRTPGARCVDPRAALWDAMAELVEEIRARGLNSRQVWRERPGPKVEPPLQYADESAYNFDDPEHLTPYGHLALAELLFEELQPSLAVQ